MTHRMVTAIAVLATSALCMASVAVAAGPNDGIADAVRAVFADAPDMVAVAKCESGFRQFNADGSVLRGGAGGKYLGIFQIGEELHRARALAEGMDIDTVAGNIAYARKLFDAQGSRPWISCVPKTSAVTAAPAAPSAPPAASVPSAPPSPTAPHPNLDPVTADLRLGVRSAQAQQLQRILNALGFTIAASGPGSAGSETTLFGGLTRDALRRFQCAHHVVCGGSEATTGYGLVGPRTRAALRAALGG